MGVKIISSAYYLPENVMTNDDWAKLVDTSDEWITIRTGIKHRHIALKDQATSDLVTIASKKALEKAAINKDEIDLVLVSTVTPDNFYPSTANWVQNKLNLRPVPSFDIAAACCGFLYGLILAHSLIESNIVNTILLAGAETMSKVINWEDRNTAVLFGDGAGALILQKTLDNSKGLIGYSWGSDGSLGNLLIQPAGGSAMPASFETVEKKLHTVHMSGNEVFKYAVIKMCEAAHKALDNAHVAIEDIDLFIPHQANIRIIDAVQKRFNIANDKMYKIIHEVGNMSSATIPVAIAMAIDEGYIKPGSKVLLSAFGAGFTWAGAVVQL